MKRALLIAVLFTLTAAFFGCGEKALVSNGTELAATNRDVADLAVFEATQADLDLLSEFQSLRRLSIHHTEADDIIYPLSGLNKHNQLSRLELMAWYSNWTARSLSHLPLEHLRISSPIIDDDDFAALELPQTLTFLDIRECSSISDATVWEIVKLKSLKKVYLGFSSISMSSYPILQQYLPDTKVYEDAGGPLYGPEHYDPVY